MSAFLLAAVCVVIVLALGLLNMIRSTRVSPGRLERFARRQALVITPGNRDLVIGYLVTTRRWRVAGLSLGILISIGWSLRDSRITVNALTAFAGWFVGAMVAEYRVATLEARARRAASLEPRLLRRQLGTAARTLPVLLFAVAAVCAGASLLAAAAGREVRVALVLGHAVAAVLALALPVLVGRHVLARPRPLTRALDRQFADDALRDRSLQVLAGCAIALTAFAAGDLALDLSRALDGTQLGDLLGLVGALLPLAGPICGWVVATRARSRPPAPAALGPEVAYRS
jgi:hypothetical protein